MIINRLGIGGDGFTTTPEGRPAIVPRAAAGDVIIPDPAATHQAGKRLVIDRAVLRQASPDRHPPTIPPLCPFFGHLESAAPRCGGCTTLHLHDRAYQAWKYALLRHIFDKDPVWAAVPDPVWQEPVWIPFGRRWRVDLALGWDGAGAPVVGLHQQGTHDIVPLAHCPACVPQIQPLVAALPSLIGGILVRPQRAEAQITALPTGTEMCLTIPHALNAAQRETALKWANEHGVTRLAVTCDRRDYQVLGTMGPLVKTLGDYTINLPAASFLQASAEAETALQNAVASALAPWQPKRLGDLFCGHGTFALGLASLCPTITSVLAVDGNPRAIAALAKADRPDTASPQIIPRVQDLLRRPLGAHDLTGLDAVILDPARAGAPQQTAALARHRIATVVYVSCVPEQMIKDTAPLHAAGYRIASIAPVDQFPHTPHWEAVVTFRLGQ